MVENTGLFRQALGGEDTFGFHHEDWFRASQLLVACKARHSKPSPNPRLDARGRLVAPKEGRDTTPAPFIGYATEERVKRSAKLGKRDKNVRAATDMARELSKQGERRAPKIFVPLARRAVKSLHPVQWTGRFVRARSFHDSRRYGRPLGNAQEDYRVMGDAGGRRPEEDCRQNVNSRAAISHIENFRQ
ncbi:hypothetical protein OCS_02695 [Ophiocordyceps sinensis CO18]|nr:hypothetical protein OCS_02695 [Ophiocordyceps sinensis CO18]